MTSMVVSVTLSVVEATHSLIDYDTYIQVLSGLYLENVRIRVSMVVTHGICFC